MVARRVMEGVTMIRMGGVNAYLLEGPEGLTLVDAGSPGRSLGSRRPPGPGGITPATWPTF
jgi:hypothetical protein